MRTMPTTPKKVVRPPDEREMQCKELCRKHLAEDRVQLMFHQPFIASVLMQMNVTPIIDSRCSTACTDGKSVFVNADFYECLQHAHRLTILAHEVWHIVYAHALRRGSRDMRRFNVAADMEVNFMLAGQDFSLPQGALLPFPAWGRLSAEEIYRKLPKESADRPLDRHLEPTAGNAMPSEENARAEKVHDPDFKVDFGDVPGENGRRIVLSAAAQMRNRGELPAELQKVLAAYQTPKLDWKQLLSQYVCSCFNGERHWLPPNRRYLAAGWYFPSRREHELRATLAIDTSGSTEPFLQDFIREVNGLLASFGNYDLTVIQADAKIQRIDHYTPETPLDRSQVVFSGFGGTDFRPVFDHVAREGTPQVLIYLTDGFGPVHREAPPFPVIWCIAPHGEIPAPWGNAVFLPPREE